MGIGAFTGVIVTALLATAVPNGIVRLVIAMVVGGVMAGAIGFLIGIPVLRLRGDYLAIVTLAFGEIELAGAQDGKSVCRASTTYALL